MKKAKGPSKVIIFMIVLTLTLSLLGVLLYKNYVTYKSIEVKIKKNTIEYGSANYNLKEIVSEVDGEIVSIKKSINTNILGKQELVVEVVKDSVSKEIPIEVKVVDSVAPNIELKEEKISITYGEDINLLDNISSVIDMIDGNIEYKNSEEVTEDMTNYYRLDIPSDINEVGSHTVDVVAVDKSHNISTKSFEVEVEPLLQIFDPVVYNDLPANGNSSSLVDIAYSLIGSPYVAGGNSPSGFDCSGFVQYVYGQTGKYISRSSSTQVYDGVAVSYENALPGDILSWGYGQTVTHSALYVGNGLMIHAANPGQGVILSNVSSWINGSGTYILSVRRII